MAKTYRDNMETEFYGFLNQRNEGKEINWARSARGEKRRSYRVTEAKKRHLVKIARYWVRAGGAI